MINGPEGDRQAQAPDAAFLPDPQGGPGAGAEGAPPAGGSRPPLVIVARHGSTNFNSGPGASAERVRGWIDVPLNAEGLQEAQTIARTLAQVPVQLLMTSDLQRARNTAEAIAQATGVSARPTSALRPWNLGQLQGMETKKIFDVMKRLQVDTPDQPAPGGESYNQFLQRFVPALKAAFGQAKQLPDQGAVVMVTHIRNVGAMIGWLKGGAGDEIDPQAAWDAYYEHPAGEMLAAVGTPTGWAVHSKEPVG